MFSIDFNQHFNVNKKKYNTNLLEIYNKIEKEKKNNSNFLGWIDYTIDNKTELLKVIEFGKKFRKYDILVVIGIGGSFLGSKSIYELLKIKEKNKFKTNILFIGNDLSGRKLKNIIIYLKNKNFCVNVISKSWNTLETCITFRLIKNLLEKKYGQKYTDRIIFTTDKNNYKLINFANKKNILILKIPSNIGGRYSLFTASGIFPLTVAGFNTINLLKGIKKAKIKFDKFYLENPAYKYAALRNLAFKKGYCVEIFTAYDDTMYYFMEWLKQLFGESEGKNGKGIYPISVINTRDLHSLGQFFQEGTQKHFETIIWIDKDYNCLIPNKKNDFDSLNYLKGITVDNLNKQIMLATRIAHNKINIPNILINIDEINEENLGEIYYFFMISCVVTCYLLGVNPFNQPGVEKYKNEVKIILKKLQKNRKD